MCLSLSSGLAAAVLLTGCKREQSQTAPPPHSPPSALQAEIDRANLLPFEADPDRRPLIISQPNSSRSGWTLAALKRGYAESGHTNTAWDARVETLFAAYAELTTGNMAAWPSVVRALETMPPNCDDPMVQYMQRRYRAMGPAENPEAVAVEYLRVQEAMLNSRYHPAFKFIAGARAVDTTRQMDPRADLNSRIFFTMTSLEDLARDTNNVPEQVFDMIQLWLEQTRSKGWFDWVMRRLQPILERNWAREERWFRFRGWLEVEYAAQVPGGSAARKPSDEGWKALQARLNQAESFLSQAWQMNSNVAETAYLMMRVELGQGQGLPRMETWFHRAMALEPNYDDAARLMTQYLEPGRYGSEQQMLEFARSCVASTNWRGRVPLVLVEAHYHLAGPQAATNSAYWNRPQVWADVHAAYEKFFQVNTNVLAWHHNYAKDAFLCGQYGAFLEQTKQFSSVTNFEFFGGEARFKEMLAKASQ